MKLERCTCQGKQSLDQAFQVFASRGCAIGTNGQAMLDLIERLRESGDSRTAWALTSHATMCLLAADDFRSPWLVMVFAPSFGGFRVEYLLPREQAPWPRAYVSGDAGNLDEAVEMVLLAMDRCGGWSEA